MKKVNLNELNIGSTASLASFTHNTCAVYTPKSVKANQSSIKKPAKKSLGEIKFISDDDFADGSLLSYTDHELTEEQLGNITNYFIK